MNVYGRLMRLDRPVGIWLLFWPCIWGLALGVMQITANGIEMPDMTYHFIRHSLLFFIGAVVMRSAGCIINDIWDRKLDAKVARTKNRPLASGEVKLRQALLLLTLLLTLASIIWLQLGWLARFLCIIAMGLVVAYPAMKRITWWPQAFLGITFNFGILIGYAAATNHLNPAIMVMYLGAMFWTIGYDTIYAHQDIEDDRMIGIKSTALKFQANARKFVALCYALSMLLWWFAAMLFRFPWWGYVLLIAVALHLVWQLARWQPEDADSSLKTFKENVITAILMAAIVTLLHIH
ncbi:MAG TPA: 4-hydroxybenzoate octaprenyltransferase [Alphaproteobacteria bacterium]|nr:4-hydroxybenzoate octaprenyltransferase [Alphaproteobacteria bacterium]